MRDQYLWRKQASDAWLREHETKLLAHFGQRVAFIERLGKKQTTIEISCATPSHASDVVRILGGKFQRIPKTIPISLSKPLKIGTRLTIDNVGGASAPRAAAKISSQPGHQVSSHIVRKRLVIPASTAFGTGEHATTAMCLRMLERATRRWRNGWTMLDAGTGTGILALAAKSFGAKDVIGIDNDPRAISIARENARSNQIDGIRFKIGDVTKLKRNRKLDLIAANLFSEILIKAIPKWQARLKSNGILILSGILRSQEREVIRALRKHRIAIEEIRRRGKWVAILARVAQASALRMI